MKKSYAQKGARYRRVLILLLLAYSSTIAAQVVLEDEIKISDLGLHLNGDKVAANAPDNGDDDKYDRYFGANITAKGDCIKSYGDYVFMTWYRGGKTDRHVMLTRYNTVTGSMATIEFPHRHTGYLNQWWIGEAHNAIAIGISPIDGTIHLLYDMHAYSANRPSNGSLANDYFRYTYSLPNTAGLPDADFTLDKFVQSSNDMYKHLKMPGTAPQSEFLELTYPHFFLNDDGDLFMWMRRGGHTNGMYKFISYDASTGNWGNFVDFNSLNANSQPGIQYNWGLYGTIKYENGKIRIGFQRRLGNSQDKFSHQNGVYYAYSDNQNGVGGWKNHKGESFDTPLYDSDFIKVMEPGDYVQTTVKDKVHIVSGFDWTVTDNEDVHIISRVKDNENNVTKYLHTYKPSGATEFITSEDFSGGEAVYTLGNSVFLIGLKNGRVFVEKAEGGTNNFTRVYEATTGKLFRHGRVHIANGKAYYYLMENLSGSAQPIYLQIIDLDIVQEPFRVTLTNPNNGETVYTGETVQITADAIDENGSISKVDFMVNGTLFGEDTTEPYALDWTPDTKGAYTVQAVAYNANNETVSSNEITVNIKVVDSTDPPCPELWLEPNVYKIATCDLSETELYMTINVTTGQLEWAAEITTAPAEATQLWTVTNHRQPASGGYVEITADLSALGAGPWTMIVDQSTYDGSGSDPEIRVSARTGVPISDTSDENYGYDQFQRRKANGWTDAGNNALFAKPPGQGNFRYSVAPAAAGDQVRFQNGGAISPLRYILVQTLSTEEFEDNSFLAKIYPNPAKDEFTILLNDENNARIVIYNMLGKIVYEDTITSNRLDIANNGRFNSGLYLIKITDDNQRVFHSKLMIR
ncbi:T9SS type A sorting domain-containing protein [Cognatitamlana onchidii]|uniref:T9SS type A sorting domain-containing protein n=1 Tax=Cognatitamlana onchidii TaxID=2562860 RepID=UPI0010A6B66A|nr:BNR-4 repeat-containing protein [Algibacter onchidii]